MGKELDSEGRRSLRAREVEAEEEIKGGEGRDFIIESKSYVIGRGPERFSYSVKA